MEEVYSRDREAIGSELIHYVNSLIEPLASDVTTNLSNSEKNSKESSFHNKSALKHESNNNVDQAWVVGEEAVDDLKDIIKLVRREIEGGPESERYAISLLVEWNVIGSKLMPLWYISSDNIEIQSLIIQLLFWLTLSPDENWRRFHSKTMKCNAYHKNMQKVKHSLLSGEFWEGVLSLYRKLKKVVEDKGFMKEDRDELRKREEFILKLKEEDNEKSDDINKEVEEKDEVSDDEGVIEIDIDKLIEEGDLKKSTRLERLEIRRKIRDEIMLINDRVEKRNRLYKNRIGMIRGLVIQTLKISDPNANESLSMFGVKSPHLILVSRLISGGILEIIEDDSTCLSFNNEYGMIDESQLVAPWRILEYIYGLICNIQPIDFVNELFERKVVQSESEKFKNKIIEKIIKRSSSTGFTSNSLMNRHSRFNPVLSRKRISESKGLTTIQLNNSRHGSTNRIVKYRHGYDIDEMFDYMDILIGPMQSTGGNVHSLDMYGFNTIEGTLGNIDGMNRTSYHEILKLLGEFLDNFFKTKLHCLLDKIFIILRNGSDKHNIWDLSRLISLMTWILSYKREIFYQVTREENDVNSVNDELTRMVLEIKILIDTTQNMTVDFIHSTIKHHTRETLMKNKSHKLVRISLRCLNEQLKIIHIMANSCNDKISELGISIISFMAKLDMMNDLSWILKHYVKTTHHPEVLLYSIEVSNRLIKLISKVGGDTVVNIRRRRKDRPTDENDFINYDEENEEIYVNDKQKLPGFNENNYTERTKSMNLDEMMNDFCDGRIVSAIMSVISNYSTNHSNVNWHISRLARKIITTRPLGMNNKMGQLETQDKFNYLFSGLFFQLTYFITFVSMLSDKGFICNSKTNKGDGDVISLARHVVHQFWNVAKVNKFVFIELLFSKNSPRGMGLADPERIRSIFTNYEEGLDSEIIDRMKSTGNDAYEARMYVKSKIRKDKSSNILWSKEDDEELLGLYSQFGENHKCISLITGLLSHSKTERSVRKRLKELGKLEDDLNTFDHNFKRNKELNRRNIGLVSSIMDFKEININEYMLDEYVSIDTNNILREQGDILDESYSTRELMSCGVDDIPLEYPESIPDSLISDTVYTSLLESLGLKKYEKFGGGIWMVPKELTQEEYLKTINDYKLLIKLDAFELLEMINDDRVLDENVVEYSDSVLKEAVIEIFEDHKLCINFPKINLDKKIPNSNGLLHYLCYELKIILDKNFYQLEEQGEYQNSEWINTELENLTLCLSKERLEHLGVKKEVIQVFDSSKICKVLQIIGFKRKSVSKYIQHIINSDRGVNINADHDKKDILFDEDDFCNEYGNDSSTQELVECWTFDYENISFKDYCQRYKVFLSTITDFNAKESEIINGSRADSNLSRKFVLNLSENIHKMRTKSIERSYIDAIIDRLTEIVDNFNNYNSEETLLNTNDFDLSFQGKYSHLDPNNKYFQRLVNLLMGRQLEINGEIVYSFADLFDQFGHKKVSGVTGLMSKLLNMEMPQLILFIKSLSSENNKKNSATLGNEKDKIKTKKPKIDDYSPEKNKENELGMNNEKNIDHYKKDNNVESIIEFSSELFASDD